VNIQTVNLNLFVAFDALLSERNVTRAARRIGVTQSAVSNALRALREVFDDPLFVRGPRGVTPTPRALDLAEHVQRGLASLGAALAPAVFDPASVERVFVLAASDYVELVVLPPLLVRLAKEAPGVRIEVRPWGLHEVTPFLEQGGADLMLGYYGRVPPLHPAQTLFTERYACIARANHPRIKGRPTLRQWVETPQVVVSETPGAIGAVDRALAARGLRRTIGVRVSHFLLVPEIVARTDFVAALSQRVVDAFTPSARLRTFKAPLALPESRVGQVWHQRLDADPGHRWLRETIAEVCRSV
jgi:DNA-binding transcriptional LysR family regulator